MNLDHSNHPLTLRSQRGLTMLEVLISLALMSIIGLGAAFISTKTAVMHRDQNIHLHTVSQLRHQISSAGLDASTCSENKMIQIAGENVKVSCSLVEKTFQVDIFKEAGSRIIPATDVKIRYVEIENAQNNADVITVPIKISP
jgi:prepilin-type N-terminal cleavage/methylation domain-containing protein